jgi:hypothetical protein
MTAVASRSWGGRPDRDLCGRAVAAGGDADQVWLATGRHWPDALSAIRPEVEAQVRALVR